MPRTIGLVGLAHGTSHFFHLLLGPLFPLFIVEFGLSWSALGRLVTTFFAVSGIGQALAVSGWTAPVLGRSCSQRWPALSQRGWRRRRPPAMAG